MGHKTSECENVDAGIGPFLTQIVLFLNAGLVLDAALEQFCLYNASSKKALFIKICSLRGKSIAENVPLPNLLYLYARGIKNKELMRIALILMNHNLRGAGLADKLEGEITYLNKEGSFSIKAKIKQAETKLCFPLMLILIALITICVTPALINL